MKKLRVAVIGTGYLGKFHAEKYAQMDEVELIGIVDIDQSVSEKIAKKFNTAVYTDHREILDRVDAVSIVVPTSAHFPVAKDCLENRIDILIEKPITTSIQEADELISIADSKNLIIQVGHLERFNPAVVALQNVIMEPMFIESHRLSVYKDRATDVSVVFDLMIHDIDIILTLVKSDVKTIHASGSPVISDHVDIANARIEFENGCVANVTASRISIKNERKIRLFQKNAYISIDFAKPEVTVIQQNSNAKGGLIPGMEVKHININKGDALKDEISSFVNAVIKRKTPEVTGMMGRNALKVALSTMKQIRSPGRPFIK